MSEHAKKLTKRIKENFRPESFMDVKKFKNGFLDFWAEGKNFTQRPK